MIPDLSVMIAAYIITRMFEIMTKPESHKAVKVFAVLTVFVTIICAIDILNMGSRVAGLPSTY